MRRSDCHRMLEALSDGRRWSTVELARLGMTPHSRNSDLKKLGFTVEVKRTSTARGEKDVYFYRLVAVPAWPLEAFENTLEDQARTAIVRMRVAGATSSEGQSLHPGQCSQADAPAGAGAGLPGPECPSRLSSRPHVDRDNQAAPADSSGAPVGVDAAAPTAPSLVSGGVVAPPGGVLVLPDSLTRRRGELEDELSALGAFAETLEEFARLGEIERELAEIDRLAMGRAA